MSLYEKDSIVALATPPGIGAVALIRISGRDLIVIYKQITNSNKNPNPNFKLKFNSIQNYGDKLILRLPETEHFGPRLKLIDHTFHFTRKSLEN